jgi:hypothetical protein
VSSSVNAHLMQQLQVYDSELVNRNVICDVCIPRRPVASRTYVGLVRLSQLRLIRVLAKNVVTK